MKKKRLIYIKVECVCDEKLVFRPINPAKGPAPAGTATQALWDPSFMTWPAVSWTPNWQHHQSLEGPSYQKGPLLGITTAINTHCPIKEKVLNSYLTKQNFSL